MDDVPVFIERNSHLASRYLTDTLSYVNLGANSPICCDYFEDVYMLTKLNSNCKCF